MDWEEIFFSLDFVEPVGAIPTDDGGVIFYGNIDLDNDLSFGWFEKYSDLGEFEFNRFFEIPFFELPFLIKGIELADGLLFMVADGAFSTVSQNQLMKLDDRGRITATKELYSSRECSENMLIRKEGANQLVTMPYDSDWYYHLFDISGRTISRGTFQDNFYRLPQLELSPGIIFLEIHDDKCQFSSPIFNH